MADILVRDLSPRAVALLKERARRHGRSLQSEARRVLEDAAGASLVEALATARQWRRRLGAQASGDGAADVREDRER